MFGYKKWLPPLRPLSEELLYIDAIRFVAASGIVFLHSKEFLDLDQSVQRIILPADGFGIFVDVFFVISGFVITHVYHSRIMSLRGYREFLQRRVARLVPLHWLTLAVFVALGLIVLKLNVQMSHKEIFSRSCIPTEFLLLNAENLCPHLAFNGVSWSIGAEMAMYLIFPLLLFIARLNRVVFLCGIVVGLAFLFFGHLDRSFLNLTYDYGALRALPSFGLGILIFEWRAQIDKMPFISKLVWPLTAALIAAILANIGTVFLLMIGYALVVSGVAAEASKTKSKVIRILAAAGQLTYSIYMVHSLFIAVLLAFLGHKIVRLHGMGANIAVLLTYAVIMAAAYLSFVFVETPARRWITQLGTKKKVESVQAR